MEMKKSASKSGNSVSPSTSLSEHQGSPSFSQATTTGNPSQVNEPSKTEIQEDDEVSEYVLIVKIDNARIIYNILSTLQFKKDQFATVTITQAGIKFTVEDTKHFQGNGLLSAELFHEYHFSSQHEQFKIHFAIFMDCLSIYGNNPNSYVALQMAYGGYGTSLILMLEENGVVTNCGLKTLEPDPIHSFNFRAVPIYNKVIVDADHLRDAFNELDWSSPHVNVVLTPEPPYFRLSTSGPSGSCQIDYPKEQFETFECEQTQSNNYKLSLIQPAVKALTVANKTQIRMNETGVLSFQHMIKNDTKFTFVDFFIAPEDEVVIDE